MPVMLAVMEIPGCLVALFLVSQLRNRGLDPLGNMPGEPGYDPDPRPEEESDLHGHATNGHATNGHAGHGTKGHPGYAHSHGGGTAVATRPLAVRLQAAPVRARARASALNAKVLHEVFLNPGLYLLFGGIAIGFLSRLQGERVVKDDDQLFVQLFQGALCLFLLEMGMTACKRLKDLRAAGWRFVAFGLLAPNLFATLGMGVAHAYSMALGQPLQVGTYVLFGVLCGASSYIAVPAVQRLAIPEASPTLPLAASLGLTFSYNVTVGIPVYIEVAKAILRTLPVVGTPA
jgi:hypothetical protein